MFIMRIKKHELNGERSSEQYLNEQYRGIYEKLLIFHFFFFFYESKKKNIHLYKMSK